MLDAFGLASIQIETAGGSAQQGADMALPGLANAAEFRDAVLSRRDALSGGSAVAAAPASAPDTASANTATVELLTEIRDSLRRLEARMDEKTA